MLAMASSMERLTCVCLDGDSKHGPAGELNM